MELIGKFLCTLSEWSYSFDATPYVSFFSRIAWGCFSESQKAVQNARVTYMKKKTEIEDKLEENLQAERIKGELPDLTSLRIDDDDLSDSDTKDTLIDEMRRKIPVGDARRAERKLREIEVVYASLLKVINAVKCCVLEFLTNLISDDMFIQAAVTNDASHLLLKHNLLSKLQLEYELWCPFTESFAPYPQGIERHTNLKATLEDCRESRCRMQEKILGFVPKSRRILSVAKGPFRANHRKIFKELTTAMNELYISDYAVSDKVWKRREQIRASIEHLVSTSKKFPVGTKVAVFGSSANGFG
jgi:hypothetical protein